jgi:glycosyltransferase involved in cell wall biosynthesis
VSFHPRVSVIVPTYNRVDSLLKVIDAIVDQSYPATEIIIANNGSTDGTSEAVRRLKISNLQVIDLENSGRPSTARNAGLKVATGDWVAFCDSDDFWAPNRLSTQISQRKNGIRALCSNAWVASPGLLEPYLLYQRMPELLSIQKLLNRNWVINSSVLIEKKLLEEIGGIPSSPSLKFIEDYAAWLRVSSISPFQVISEPLITYTDDVANSIRGEQPFEHFLTSVIGWVDFLAWMRSRGRPLTMSETAITVGIPKLIATNMRLIKKGQR